MKIADFRTERHDSRARMAATVIWEDCERPSHDVYFETESRFVDFSFCNPDAFLLACAIPATHYGEKRVLVEGAVCPALRDGVTTALGWLRLWFDPESEPLRIEGRTRTHLLSPRRPERAGLLLSGGIDSLSMLRQNRLDFPSEHPWSMKDGLVVYGLELDDPAAFGYVASSLSKVAEAAGIELIPVWSNHYLQYRDEDAKRGFSLWYDKFEGAVLAAVGHALVERVSILSIAAGYDIPNQRPFAAHPLLLQSYSSADLRVRLEGAALSRFEKTRIVGEWDIALQHLRVCNQFKAYRPGALNCGRCEKCVRTMLALAALGLSHKTHAFPHQEITEEFVRSMRTLRHSKAPFYRELIAPLLAGGRSDLARAVEAKLDEYRKSSHLDKWKGALKRIDRDYAGGSLKRLKALVSGNRGSRRTT